MIGGARWRTFYNRRYVRKSPTADIWTERHPAPPGLAGGCNNGPPEPLSVHPVKWNGHPNLGLRPHSPAKGRGRRQIQIRRAFMAHGPVISSS